MDFCGFLRYNTDMNEIIQRFTRAISRIENKPSVYALVQDNIVFYVGSSISPRMRLKQHLNNYLGGELTPLLTAKWEAWEQDPESKQITIKVLYTGRDDEIRDKETQFINELEPACNIARGSNHFSGVQTGKYVPLREARYERGAEGTAVSGAEESVREGGARITFTIDTARYSYSTVSKILDLLEKTLDSKERAGGKKAEVISEAGVVDDIGAVTIPTDDRIKFASTPPSAEPATDPQDSDTLPVVRFVSFENINGAVVHKRLDGTLEEMRAEKRRNQRLRPKWVSPVLDELGAKLWLNDNMGMFRRDDTNSWKY